MLKVLLFGAAGQVGSDCLQALSDKGYSVEAVTRQSLDFADAEAVAAKVLSLKPEIVINACAYTAVDKAETEIELADKVNHLSVAALAEACATLAIPLIHLSTDYVFDGTRSSPYREDSSVNPVSVYGKTKLAGERVIQEKSDRYIILRTSWVFGEQGHNFVKTMLRLGKDRDQLKVVNDQLGRPTYVGDIVSCLVHCVAQYEQDKILPWGIYHCCSEGETSWYGFAKAIFAEAKAQGLIAREPEVLAIPSSEFPTPAPRPAYSVLSTEKLDQFMSSPLPHWQVGLKKFINHLNN